MSETRMRKWGAWMASTMFVVLTAVLAIVPPDHAQAKGAASAASVAATDGPAIASADRDVLDLQLD